MALQGGAGQPELDAEALDLLSAQVWRGNIRELRNVLEQAAMRGDSPCISRRQIEEVLREAGIEHVAPLPSHAGESPVAAPPPGALRPLAEQVAQLERQAIAAALSATQGNKLAAARLLGISRATLYERLDEVSDFQATA
ncbi:MAG: helix-turn-helix domain-containing protein [Polaromonas sp.]